jgi:hypothetical protein
VSACTEEDPGQADSQIAGRPGASRPAVTSWRDHFVAERVEGLLDEGVLTVVAVTGPRCTASLDPAGRRKGQLCT